MSFVHTLSTVSLRFQIWPDPSHLFTHLAPFVEVFPQQACPALPISNGCSISSIWAADKKKGWALTFHELCHYFQHFCLLSILMELMDLGTLFFFTKVWYFLGMQTLCAYLLAAWLGGSLGWEYQSIISIPSGNQHFLGALMDRMISMNIEEMLLGKRLTAPVPRSRWSSTEMNRLTWQKICQTLVFEKLPKSVLFWSIRTSRVMQLERFRAVQNWGGVACFHLQHHCNSPYRNLAH